MSAPVWCVNPRFAEVLAAFRARYLAVVLDLHLDNRKVDLVAEGFDLALRATGGRGHHRRPPRTPAARCHVDVDVDGRQAVAVYASRRHMPPALRALIDFFGERLSDGEAF